MAVSVIIAARNAAATIRETLDSVRAQFFQDWEVIVVDDGSTDATPEIVDSVAALDSRIGPVRQQACGVGAARNRGIDLARYDLLLFLDADDVLAPEHLSCLSTALLGNPSSGAAWSDWEYRLPDGSTQQGSSSIGQRGMFAALACRPVFPIHACVIRRELVLNGNGFDPEFPVAEDWDLWQRIARTGARFEHVPGIRAQVRLRQDSASSRTDALLAFGLRVIRNGHQRDKRVSEAAPEHAVGQPVAELPSATLWFGLYCAGEYCGDPDRAIPFDDLAAACTPDAVLAADSQEIAACLVLGAKKAAMRRPAPSDASYWTDVYNRCASVVTEMERWSRAAGLTKKVNGHLARLIIETLPYTSTAIFGSMRSVPIEVTEPIQDVPAEPTVGRILFRVLMEGEPTGVIELPVFDGCVPGFVLSDAIAARFSWQILGRFFEKTIYASIERRAESETTSLYRGNTPIAEGLPLGNVDQTYSIHDHAGWTVFLQELWGAADADADSFYSSARTSGHAARFIAGNRVSVEVSTDLPNVISAGMLEVVPMIGGAPLGIVSVKPDNYMVSAQQLRAAITVAAGYELCCAAVREALIGGPFEGLPLRQRLAERAASAAPRPTMMDRLRRLLATKKSYSPAAPGVAATWSGTVIGARTARRMGGSASRRAALPSGLKDLVIRAAAQDNLPVIHVGAGPGLIYNPGMVGRNRARKDPADTVETGLSSLAEKGSFDRAYWESLFAGSPDPWDYENSYEELKYAQTLSLIPDGLIGRALEAGCAEGHFTGRLAERVEHLTAADISAIALDRAKQRCAGLLNISWMQMNLADSELHGPYDLIVCSEVLYYSADLAELRRVATKLAAALRPGGWLISAHSHVIADDPDLPGFDWGHAFGGRVISQVLSEAEPLSLLKTIMTPLYRVQAFQRGDPAGVPAEFVEGRIAEPLPPRVEKYVRWRGKRDPVVANRAPVTSRLPILMYHRVAPHGSDKLTRWRIEPRRFEEQMQYLAETGYRTIKLEEWRNACMARQPIPGRAVIITFDDGFADFEEFVWPVMEKYRFLPYLFLPARLIGKTNRWDAPHEELPLLDLKTVSRLVAEGLRIGSHGAAHLSLTSIPIGDAVAELISSRTELGAALGMDIDAIAYPFGDTDPVIAHLAGACGYEYGLTAKCVPAPPRGNMLDLPRIEVRGTDNFNQFVANLASGDN